METGHTSTPCRLTRVEARALRIGSALKRRRIALGLSQADLAVLSGITRSDYELVEKGEWPGQPSDEQAAAIIAAVVSALDSQLAAHMRAA